MNKESMRGHLHHIELLCIENSGNAISFEEETPVNERKTDVREPLTRHTLSPIGEVGKEEENVAESEDGTTEYHHTTRPRCRFYYAILAMANDERHYSDG